MSESLELEMVQYVIVPKQAMNLIVGMFNKPVLCEGVLLLVADFISCRCINSCIKFTTGISEGF